MKKNIQPNEAWNELIKLRDTTKNSDTKRRCIMYLEQILTAGNTSVKKEAANFLNLLNHSN